MNPPAADGAAAAAGAGGAAFDCWDLAGGGADRGDGAEDVDAERRCGGAARRRGEAGLEERRPMLYHCSMRRRAVTRRAIEVRRRWLTQQQQSFKFPYKCMVLYMCT